MAFALVNPVTALWQRRGLTSLLMPDNYDAFAAPQEPARALSDNGSHVLPAHARAGQAPAGQSPFSGAQPHSQAGQPRERQSWQQSRQQGTAAGQASTNQNQSNLARQQVTNRTAQAANHAAGHTAGLSTGLPAELSTDQGKPAAWLPLPPHVWPAPWQTRLEQTRPGPVLWTYWNLGPDLCDPQTPGRLERRQFLQRLLQDLGHPAGTHTFWPSCLPPDPAALPITEPQGQDNAYVANPDVFWSGAMQLKARGVVVMGSAAARALALPGGLRPPQQIRHRGKIVWVLWDVDNLLQIDQRYASMLALLRDALRHFLR